MCTLSHGIFSPATLSANAVITVQNMRNRVNGSMRKVKMPSSTTVNGITMWWKDTFSMRPFSNTLLISGRS